MKKCQIAICLLAVAIILYKEGGIDAHAYQTVNPERGTMKDGENAGEMTVEELAGYFSQYGSYNSPYKETFIEEMNEKLSFYFPNMEDNIWKITEKREDGHIAQFYSMSIGETGKYKVELLIKPDFSMELLKDTVEINPDMGMCIYAKDRQYPYHGCRIDEYEVSAYNSEKDVYLKAVIPLFSMEQDPAWEGVNRSIWEGLEQWFNGEMDCAGGELSLDYEIKELNGDLYSILLFGEHEKGNGAGKHVAVGITVSIAGGNVLDCSVFTKEKTGAYDFYIENGGLYFLNKTDRDDGPVYKGEVEFLRYELKRKEGQVYAANGRWIGQCYYELIEVDGYPEGIQKINQHLMEDMGKFFREVRTEFEKGVLERDEGVVYGAANDYETILGSPGYHCYVRSEVCYNNAGEFGVVYHYKFCLDSINEEGDSFVVYDSESGEVLMYQDWQKKILEEVNRQNGMVKPRGERTDG